MMKKANVFIVGLDRCSKVCAPALADFFRNLFPASVDVNYHIYVWLPDGGRIINERSDEEGDAVKEFSSDWFDEFGVEPIATIQPSIEQCFGGKPYYHEIRARGDIYDDGFRTVSNYFIYLHELRSASDTFSDLVDHSAPCLLIRSDLKPEEVDGQSLFEEMSRLQDGMVYVPPWNSCSFCNDRMMVGSTKTVLRLMQREMLVENFLSKMRMCFQSETFLHFCIKDVGLRQRVLKSKCEFSRVRSNGKSKLEKYDRGSILNHVVLRSFFFKENFKFRIRRLFGACRRSVKTSQ